MTRRSTPVATSTATMCVHGPGASPRAARYSVLSSGDRSDGLANHELRFTFHAEEREFVSAGPCAAGTADALDDIDFTRIDCAGNLRGDAFPLATRINDVDMAIADAIAATIRTIRMPTSGQRLRGSRLGEADRTFPLEYPTATEREECLKCLKCLECLVYLECSGCLERSRWLERS
jgi:hypothetical protein